MTLRSRFKEETGKTLHLQDSYIWYWYLNTSQSRSKYLGNFEKWHRRRMKNLIWADRVKTEVLRRDTKEISYIK